MEVTDFTKTQLTGAQLFFFYLTYRLDLKLILHLLLYSFSYKPLLFTC